MVQEMYPYCEVTVSSFLRVHWQGSEINHSFASSAEIVNVWSKRKAECNYNMLSLHWSESIENFWIRNFF